MLRSHPARFLFGLAVSLLIGLAIYAIPVPELGAKAALACSVCVVGGALAFVFSV